jgi:signal transduction histidine kinase/ligand-binding sensor domain-containing protein
VIVQSSVRNQWALTILLIAGGCSNSSFAQVNVERLADYTHTVWTKAPGVPDYVYSMAQTPDGWIWLASRSHLYRFDGVTAEEYKLGSGDSTTIGVVYATKSGDLWLGYASRLTLKLPAGDFRHPHRISGIVGEPHRFLEDPQGTMWAITLSGLFKAGQSEWKRVGQEAGLPGRVFYSALIDTDGTLWVLNDQGIFHLTSGQTQFEPRGEPFGGAVAHRDPADQNPPYYFYRAADLYLSATLSAYGKRTYVSYPSAQHYTIVDTEGLLWQATTDGVFRTTQAVTQPIASVIATGPFDEAPLTDKRFWQRMSSCRPFAIMEDRQHNIWVSTATGLERFRANIANSLTLPATVFNYAMLSESDGSIWFGNAVGQGRHGWWHVTDKVVPATGYSYDTTAVYRDSDGSVLLGTGDGYLHRFAAGSFSPLRDLPSTSGLGDDIIAIARDGRQTLWVGIKEHPVYQFKDGRWVVNGGFTQLPDQGLLRAVTDSRGRLWLGYPDAVFVVDGSNITRYGSDVGMTITNVRDILPEEVPLIGGDSGLAAFDGRRFHVISAADPSILKGINGLVRLADGTVWLNGSDGAVRIPADQIVRGMSDASYKIQLRVIGIDEGMPGTAQPNRPVPSLIQGTDGRLWFANAQGIAWLDPSKLSFNPLTPSLVVRSITVGDQTYAADFLRELPAGTQNIQIDYTAIGLGNPSRARFRYQLIGIDKDWQDVGSRRQAFYSNLGPGTYYFRLSAATEDGAWHNAPSDLMIAISPYFYQTQWFLLLCMGIALFFCWLAYRYRILQITQRLRQRLEERHAERERIARELHDTYLQTVHSLVLKVHAASLTMPDDTSRRSIAGALQLADRALAEGRDRVQALRTSVRSETSLNRAFERIAGEYEAQGSPSLRVTLKGAARSLDPLIVDELYASGREAIVNAFKHSAAQTIDVLVSYDDSGAMVVVSDDGRGIDPKVMSAGGVAGHWGLRGMRERMDRIGGSCRITSDREGGTCITLFVGASSAYVHW